MQTVRLASSGLAVSCLGFGCIGMSAFYGPAHDLASLPTLRHVVSRGSTPLDTAQDYGEGHNEGLVGVWTSLGPHSGLLARSSAESMRKIET